MEKIANLQKLPNYNIYLLGLISAINKQDKNTINQIFNEIDEELKKIRNAYGASTVRSENSWDDPEAHFREVRAEELFDLRMEYDDNLALFQLASLVQHEPVMTIKFTKMLKNLDDIRERTHFGREISKNSWDDPDFHFKAVEMEHQLDLEKEITDLMSLYIIAQSANYTQGIELITNRLYEIAPNLFDSLISKNSGTVRK